MFDAQAISQQAQENAPQMERGPIPAGWYAVTLVKFERMMNKNGSGEHLKVEFDLDNRRKIWNRYNLRNTNPKAEQIAVEQIANLCVAMGYNSIRDPWNPEELIGRKCEMLIDVDGTYNTVKAVRRIESTVADWNRAVAKPAKPAPTGPTEIPDDDLPF